MDDVRMDGKAYHGTSGELEVRYTVVETIENVCKGIERHCPTNKLPRNWILNLIRNN